MKILQINQNYNFGSTGKIMKGIDDTISLQGDEGYLLCAYSTANHPNLYQTEFLPNEIAVRKNILRQRITGLSGYGAKIKTQKAIQWIDKIQPDIIHLHNIHGDWINIELLFKYLKKINRPIVWTLHDCWSFTGRCSHFENKGCFKWKTGCNHCVDKVVYPQTYFFDFSEKMWQEKKKWFNGFKNLVIVTPSDWLGRYVKESYLNGYPIYTINNGINLNIFHVTNNKSNFLKKTNKKYIILGVASSWTRQKGLYDFIELNEKLDKSTFQIVLVGLNAKQLKKLPNDIIGIGRTQNVEELVELYSNATVFVNPTYQDNYPTVNLEAIACGTPVITYRTGGSVESVPESVGMVVEKGNIDDLVVSINQICQQKRFSSEICRNYAEQYFDERLKYLEYIHLYHNL